MVRVTMCGFVVDMMLCAVCSCLLWLLCGQPCRDLKVRYKIHVQPARCSLAADLAIFGHEGQWKTCSGQCDGGKFTIFWHRRRAACKYHRKLWFAGEIAAFCRRFVHQSAAVNHCRSWRFTSVPIRRGDSTDATTCDFYLAVLFSPFFPELLYFRPDPL